MKVLSRIGKKLFESLSVFQRRLFRNDSREDFLCGVLSGSEFGKLLANENESIVDKS